jgi:hypothetical protein
MKKSPFRATKNSAFRASEKSPFRTPVKSPYHAHAGGLDGLLGETEMEFREDGFSRTHVASGISIYIPYSAILEIAENSRDVYLRHIGYKWTVMPAHTFESAEAKAKWKAMVEARSQMRHN